MSLSIITSCVVFWRARKVSQNTNNDFGIIYEQEIRMLDPKESHYINVLKVEIKEKNEKLRKGKLDIILITFLACFFEYSRWKIIDLHVAEFTLFCLGFFRYESGIQSHEELSFPITLSLPNAKLRNKSTSQSLKILTSCRWRNKGLKGKNLTWLVKPKVLFGS